MMTIIIVIMNKGRPFALVYDPVAKEQIRAVGAMHYSLIRNTIESQLRYESDVETRNRKPLQRPVSFEATWELRFGPQNRFRVFYDVDRENRRVEILAFGIKVGNRLKLGREEVEL